MRSNTDIGSLTSAEVLCEDSSVVVIGIVSVEVAVAGSLSVVSVSGSISSSEEEMRVADVFKVGFQATGRCLLSEKGC